jgi:ATP-dependent RNA helicase RhlE
MLENNQENLTFKSLGLAEKLLAILDRLELKIPTPIQAKSIPVALEGKDLVGVAQTGTGKTLAFGLPLLQRLAVHKGRGLIILPTRELALQVDEHLKRIGSSLGLRTAVLIGGENIRKQFGDLKRNPHIIIGTPGRINDHLERKSVDLSGVKILVLDEADMMLDMGFAPQIDSIVRKTPPTRQTLLFSATMPAEIVRMAEKYMRSPLRIEVAPPGKTAEGIDQEIIVLRPDEKIGQLEKLLLKHKGSVLIFCRTKHGVKKLTGKICLSGHKAAEIHSNRSLEQRRKALAGFKSGQYRVLVATDIAARGIDVSNIELVVNFDLPDESSDYVHRIGRTARAGKTGKAVSFAAPDQIKEIRQIERLIKKTLPLTKLAEFSESFSSGSGSRGRGRFSGYAKNKFSGRRSSGGFGGKRPFKPFASRSQSDFGGKRNQPGVANDKTFNFIENNSSRGFSGRLPENKKSSSYQAKPFRRFGDEKKPGAFGARPKYGFSQAHNISQAHNKGKPFRRFGEGKPFKSQGGVFSGSNERVLTDKERFRAGVKDQRRTGFAGKRNFNRRPRF